MLLVLDEADLLFGFGHEQLLREFIQHLPGMMIFSVLHFYLSKNFFFIDKKITTETSWRLCSYSQL